MANCNEEGCLVLTTGKCINNLEIDTCPHYSEEDISIEYSLQEFENEENLTEEKSDSNENSHDVYSGKALTLKEVNRISGSSLTRFVILAGLPDAGKTTMLLSLMHLFQTSTSFEGYLFAGSETLLDFEEKSFPSKIVSEKDKANTNRTPIGPPSFLHLKVVEAENVMNSVDLVFTDISGETFKTLKDSTPDAVNFTICQRADHFALFFDAKLISSIGDRANARASGLGIIRSLSEAGTLLPHTSIQVIFSRWDLFAKTGELKNHSDFIDLLKDDISRQFGDKYHISFFEVSARPGKSELVFGLGIKDVFPVWVKKSILNTNTIMKGAMSSNDNDREFLQYQYKS